MTPDRALLDAIARASGAPPADPGQVKGGAVDAAGRVAWIETDVARLRVAAAGRILVDRKLNRQDEHNWGYEGCSVPYLEWWGDRIVAVSSEERITAVWSIATSGECEVRQIPRPWSVDGDLLCWLSDDYPGLLGMMALPSLRSLMPLPWRLTSKRIRLECKGGRVLLSPDENEWKGIERLRLPSTAQRSAPGGAEALLERVERELAPDAGADPSLQMLVEAAAIPFCDDEARGPWPVVPLWMPVYWHRHLVATGRERDAERHLACLDAIAAPLAESEPETGWMPAWSSDEGALALAVRYARRQARVQAGVCRSGELPRGWWCLLFYPAPGSDAPGSRVDPTRLTPALRRAFEILAPTAPAEIPHRY